MKAAKQLPVPSLLLMLVTFCVFGWLLSGWTEDRRLWLVIGMAIASSDFALAAPIRFIQFCCGNWLRSDKQAFLAIIGLSIVFVVAICWIHISARILVLLSAETLARLDMQMAGFSKLQALVTLIVTGMSGYCAGIFLRVAFFPHA